MNENDIEPTADQVELAGKLFDLINTAWSLRARIADTRNLRMGFVVSQAALDLLLKHRPDAGFGPAITFTPGNPGSPLLADIAVRADEFGKLDEWGIVLALAPGDPE